MIWNQLRSLLIAFPYEGDLDVLSVKKAVDRHLDEGMKSRIVLVSKKNLKPEFKPVIEGVTYVCEKELKGVKQRKNEDFEKLMEKRIDALLVCGTIGKRIEKRFKRMETTLKIGLNSTNESLKINLIPKSSEPNEMVNFAKNMLLKISNQ